MKNGNTSQKSETDWEKVRTMKDEDIDTSDIPPLPPDFWIGGVWRRGLKPVLRKKQVTFRIDSDIIDHLRAGGGGYQTRVNQILRAYVEAEKAADTKS